MITRAFEGQDTDLEDMALMEQALKMFQKGCIQLNNERLTWSEFRSFVDSWTSEMQEALGEEELPWDIEETISTLVEAKVEHREQLSHKWVDDLEKYRNSLQSPTASEANSLHEKAATPPPYVTDEHRERAMMVRRQIEEQLEVLKVEWLVEKFKELPESARGRFLSIVDELVKDR